MKIGIFIHLFHTDLFEEFSKYIKNVKDRFKEVTIIFTLQDTSEGYDFAEHIRTIYNDAIIIHHENKGTDIYSFIRQIRYIRENNIKFDYILKIHTKKSEHSMAESICWRKELIEPLVDDRNLMILEYLFKTVDNIGYVASQRYVYTRNYDRGHFNFIIRGIYNISKRFPYIPDNYMDFVGGTMFWMSYRVIEKYITEELMEYLEQGMSNGKPPLINEICPEFIAERLFTGPICYNETNIHINANKLHIYDLYQPMTFSFNNPKEIMEKYYKDMNNLINII